MVIVGDVGVAPTPPMPQASAGRFLARVQAEGALSSYYAASVDATSDGYGSSPAPPPAFEQATYRFEILAAGRELLRMQE